MLDKIKALHSEIESLNAADAAEVEVLRIKYLSKKEKSTLSSTISGALGPDEKRAIGAPLNELKTFATEKINTLREALDNNGASEISIDMSRTAAPVALGTRHPLSLVRAEIIDIFSRLGFTRRRSGNRGRLACVRSNELRCRPSRSRHAGHILHSAHTRRAAPHSYIIRTVARNGELKPPIRIICPGRVYRNEAISARAHCFFHQVEALYVDKNVSFADLRQTLLYFAREMFGPETQIRLRPSYFPFTEPSAEMDISCNLCGGKGCSFCKHTGWVEILGCGMVDPAVLEACGIDSKEYSGFALGMGVERITNLKYQVNDLRLFSENDTRFLDEFTSAHK